MGVMVIIEVNGEGDDGDRVVVVIPIDGLDVLGLVAGKRLEEMALAV